MILLLAAGLLALLIARGFLIPQSFNEYGFFRGKNVGEQMNIAMRRGAVDACQACHGTVWETHQKGSHKTVHCQNCHDSLSAHVDLERGELLAAMPIQKEAKLCLRCHATLPSRPKSFPQIDAATHGAGGDCFACHAPHSPKGVTLK